MADNGVIGKGFQYLLKENSKHNFDWNKLIVVTDKIDGTTTQADNKNLYQRRDKLKKGDPLKFTASEEERYSIEKLEESNPSNTHIFKAYNMYKDNISRFPDGLVVYFECFGDKIQGRYKGFPPNIRVFDLAKAEGYLSFEETIDLSSSYGLPLVGRIWTKFSGVEEIVKELYSAKHEDKELGRYELEGWVLRQGNEIAKIRKDDLTKIKA